MKTARQAGIKCDVCQSDQVAVVDKRACRAGIRRRRKCLNCGYRFSTKEIVVQGSVKLNVQRIKALRADGRTYDEIGKIMGASTTTIWKRDTGL